MSWQDPSADIENVNAAYRMEREENERLHAALRDLYEDAQDMRSYVPDYFAKKWKHDEALARAATALGEEREA